MKYRTAHVWAPVARRVTTRKTIPNDSNPIQTRLWESRRRAGSTQAVRRPSALSQSKSLRASVSSKCAPSPRSSARSGRTHLR